jgi:NAD(P)-dependent dehydrogenase (short-subunit alcohol dehydrogenase family)
MFKPSGVSVDGYEIHFATNHLGHAMLVQQLLPVLLKTAELPGADVRVLNLTSLGFTMHPRAGITFDTLNTAQDSSLLDNSYTTYGQSKLANILYAAELARRHPSITAVSVHPGVVKTDLVSSVHLRHRLVIYVSQYLQGARPLEQSQGVLNQVWAAAGARKEELVNGAFYTPIGVESNDMLDKTAKSEELAAKLWDWSTRNGA